MNKRARLNYINALSQNVEHKKMYKAKKQWVVAGISFLVATGMGAIGSHLTTHADTTNQPQTTSIEKQAGKLANSVKQNAAQYQMASSSNPMNETQSAQPSKASATPASNKVSGNQVSSLNAKSSVASSVATSGNGMNTLNLGTKSEQNKGWNYVQNGIKPSSNSQSQSSANNKPLVKLADLGTPAPSNIITGTFGTGSQKYHTNPASFIFNSDTGDLIISNGDMTDYNKYNSYYDGGAKRQVNTYAYSWPTQINQAKVKHISFSGHVLAPSNAEGLFANRNDPTNNDYMKPTWWWSGTNMEPCLNHLESINLTNLDFSNTQEMKELFRGDINLKSVVGLSNSNKNGLLFDTSFMFIDDTAISDIDLSHINTNTDAWITYMFANCPNLKKINLSNFDTTYVNKINDSGDNTNGHGHMDPYTGMFRDTNGLRTLILGPKTHITAATGLNTGRAWAHIDDKGLQTVGSGANKINYASGLWTVIPSASDIGPWAIEEANDYSNLKYTSAANAIASANATISADNVSLSKDQSYINWLNSSETSLTNASNSANANSLWIAQHDSSLASAYNSANDADKWIHSNSTSAQSADSWVSKNSTSASDADSWVYANSASLSSLTTLSEDVDNIENLNLGSNLSLKYDISSMAQSLTNASAEISWVQNSSSAIENSLQNAIIQSGSTNSSVINSLETDSNSTSQELIKDEHSLFGNGNNSGQIKSLSSTIASLSSSASNNHNADNGSIGSLNTRLNQDETSLTTASSNASSVAKWLTSDSATLSSASESAYSAYSYYSNNSSAISNAIKEASNVSGAQSSFSTAYSDATNASSWISNNSNSFAALSGKISTLSGKVDNDKQNLDSAIAANASDISYDLTILSNDIIKVNNSISTANQLASNNKGVINDLKKNTAITLTFVQGNKIVGIPTTLTNSYIEGNAPKVKGTSDTYNVTSLLENSLPSGTHIDGNYDITLGESNGIATMNLDNNTVTQGNHQAPKKFALGAINPLLKAGVTTSAYVPNTNKAKSNPVNVSGNPVDYSGNITLNFVDSSNNKIKSITVPYNVNSAVGNTINLLENATNGNPNVSDATKYLDQTIQGFDTHNFSYDSGNQQGDYNFKIPVSDNSGHTTNVAYKSRDLTFTFKANSETETINYIDEATNNPLTEKGSAQGANDTQGVITSKNASSYNLPTDYQVVNNAPFTFAQNGSVNVLVAKKGTENKDNSNDTHSNVSNTKPTKPSDVAHTFTITINDHYNSDGKQQTKTYQKYIVEKGAEGSTFTINPSDYTTYGYDMNASDKQVNGTITNTGLSTTGTTWTYTAKTASSDNNSGNYKPSDVTPNNVKPSDLTKNPSANNPQNKNNVNNAKHGYATLYLVEKINGQNHKVIVKTINENNLDTTANYDIKANDYTPNGYSATPSDKNLTGHIKTDGSLSNGTATFYYDVNASEIAPISITDKNQNGDYVDYKTGSDLGKTNSNKATYTIGSQYLATLGALGDNVNIYDKVYAPNGYHFTNSDSVKNEFSDIQLISPQVSLGNPLGEVKMVLTVSTPTSKPNSNANKPASSAAQISMNSAQLSSFATEIGNHIIITPQSEVNETVDGSALNSLASEVATNNQEISNLANKPASNATNTINYDYFNNLVNSGVSQLTDVINKDFKVDIHNTAKTHTTNITKGFKPVKKHIRWIMITKPVKLYNKHGMAKTLGPSKVTLDVHSVYKAHGYFVFKVSYRNHTYFMADNHSTFKNAYLAQGKFVGRRVRVTKPVYEFRHKDHDIVKLLHKGSALKIRRVVKIGNFNMTRIQLSNGNWISANKNYIKVL